MRRGLSGDVIRVSIAVGKGWCRLGRGGLGQLGLCWYNW